MLILHSFPPCPPTRIPVDCCVVCVVCCGLSGPSLPFGGNEAARHIISALVAGLPAELTAPTLVPLVAQAVGPWCGVGVGWLLEAPGHGQGGGICRVFVGFVFEG